MMAQFWIEIVLFLLPIYVTNSSAMVFGGKTPLDLNITWSDGRRLLGTGKTFKGTFFGVFFGTLTALLLSELLPGAAAALSAQYVLFGFVISCGAVAGDIVKSFFKRRLGRKSGEEFFVVDQLDFIAGALLVGWFFFQPSIEQIAIMILLTIGVHKVANFIAFKTNLKSVPW